MDPSSVAFTPQSEFWQLSNTLRNVQEIQQDHTERLIRLERRTDDEARIRSVWGQSSPFPSILSGTPNQGPTRHQSTLDFPSFDDDQSSNMIRSLQLDAEEEPRRVGATSRANSVRFDDSANQAQVSHTTRPSLDLASRTSSGLSGLAAVGGIPMLERSSSHKSDGRHSSTGQSAVSGRANSLGLDTTHPLSQPPSQAPGLAPGLFILGAVPSIIRCWLNTNFKSDSILYAAICTGSYKSLIDVRLVTKLGYEDQVEQDINGDNKIKLAVFLPEAVPQSSSSRQGGSPQLPAFTVDFSVVDQGQMSSPKAIQCFIGSDVLRAHNADILMSTNSMTIFDDDRNKWSIPMVRPENDSAFKSLTVSSAPPGTLKLRSDHRSSRSASAQRPSLLEEESSGLGLGSSRDADTGQSDVAPEARPRAAAIGDEPKAVTGASDDRKARASQESDRKPSLVLNTSSRSESKDVADSGTPGTSSLRSSTSPAIWNNWRRDGGSATQSQNDWAAVSRSTSNTYNRPSRDAGIKVLKPTRQLSRSSVGQVSASPSVSGQSRFFDDGKRRNGAESDSGDSQGQSRKVSGDASPGHRTSAKENAPPVSGKSRSSNPIGGASAFGWLNSSGSQSK